MKKVVCFIIAIMLMAGAAMAEESFEFDFTGYSLDELITIRHMIEEEINGRVNTASATLYPGDYVAGVDLAAGSYILTGLMDEGPDGHTPEAIYYGSIKERNNRTFLDNNYLYEGEMWRITLTDGMVLTIQFGEMMIHQAPPILFAP